jgi:hypothetical protein
MYAHIHAVASWLGKALTGDTAALAIQMCNSSAVHLQQQQQCKQAVVGDDAAALTIQMSSLLSCAATAAATDKLQVMHPQRATQYLHPIDAVHQ